MKKTKKDAANGKAGKVKCPAGTAKRPVVKRPKYSPWFIDTTGKDRCAENPVVTHLRDSEFYPIGREQLVLDISNMLFIPKTRAVEVLEKAIATGRIVARRYDQHNAWFYLKEEPITHAMKSVVLELARKSRPPVEGSFQCDICQMLGIGTERAESILERCINAGLVRREGCNENAAFWGGETREARLHACIVKGVNK